MPPLTAVRAERYRRDFAAFVVAAWPIIEPARPLVWGKVLDAIALHLEAVKAGKILNLVISVPPNTAKSILVSVMLPAWIWADDPSERFLCAANEDSLVVRDSVRCRHLLESEWYREHFPAVRLTSDQNEKWNYANTRLGYRQSVTIGGRSTGKKGNWLLADDAHDARKVLSRVDRDGVKTWWRNVFFNRVIDAKTGRRIVIGQRTHDDDLNGYLVREGGFVELRLPEEFEPAHRCETSIGWRDWRQEPGELLRPELFGPSQVEEAKRVLGPTGYAAQHQQRPVIDGGAHFKEKNLRWYSRRGEYVVLHVGDQKREFLPSRARRFTIVDPAASISKRADFTVIGDFCISPWADLVWLDAERFKAEIPDIVPHIQAHVSKWRPDKVGIEAVASNRGVFQLACRATGPAILASPLDPAGRDKLPHAAAAITLVATGRVYLPTAEANPDFPVKEIVAELIRFTGDEKADEHDDAVDVLSYGAEELASGPGTSGRRNALPTVIGG